MSKAPLWSDEECANLRALWIEREESETLAEFDRRVSKLVGRSARAIENQRRRMGLLAGPNWTPEEDARLREAWEEYAGTEVEVRGTVKEFDTRMADELGKSYFATQRRRHDLDPPLKLDQGGTQPQPAPTGKPSAGIKDELREMDLLDYTLVEGVYYFPVGGGLWQVPAETWEWVCGQYSSEGANRTAKEIARDLAWPVGVLQTCLRQAKQYKASLPMSRETIITEPVDELAERTYAEKEKAAVAQFHRMRDRRWEREVMELKRWKVSQDRYIEAAKTLVADRTAPPKPGRVAVSAGAEWVAHIPTTDVHVGLHVWKDETFSETHYDTEIACSWLRRHAELAAEWIAGQPGRCTRVYMTDLGDMINASKGTTEHGTPISMDSRHPKVKLELCEALTYRTECFRQVTDHVEVEIVPGNHEGRDAAFEIMHYLNAYYRNESDVTVNVHPEQYRTFRVKDTLHVLDHGYSVGSVAGWKAKAQADSVARESGQDDYHGAKWIVTYYGHLHRREEAPQGGHHRIIRLPAFAPSDDYATRLRFAGRPAASFFRLDEKGRIGAEKIVYADDLGAQPA